MKTTTLILFAACLLLPTSYGADKILTEKVGEIITETASLKEGNTRANLQKYFTVEGGLSTPSQRTYVSKRCRNIKIDVQFRPVNVEKESAGDVIQKISKPYLNLSIVD